MSKTVTAYLSLQSPYCYFLLPRLARLSRHPSVHVVFRLVSPGVLRIGGAFAERSAQEQAYFLHDVARTAAFCGLDYAEADPYPVAFKPGSLWVPEADQPRIGRLLDLVMAASERGRGLQLYTALMTLIWDGRTRDWHLGSHVTQVVKDAGLEIDELEALAASARDHLRANLRANDVSLIDSGHWGVPCLVVDGEPFYGQDRFDQLLWRLAIDRNELPD